MEVSKVINLIQSGRVFDLTPEHFQGRFMRSLEVEAIFKAFDAFWQYQGDPCEKKPTCIA